MKLTIAHKGMIIVFVPLLVQVVCLAALYSLQSELERELDREHRSRTIIETADKAVKDLYFGIYSVHTKQGFNIGEASRAFNKISANIKDSMQTLSELVKDNAEEAEIVRQIDSELSAITSGVAQARSLAREGDIEQATTAFRQSTTSAKKTFVQASHKLISLVDREKLIANESPLVVKHVRNQLQMALASALAANIILAALFALLFNRNISSRIRTVSENILRLASAKELHQKLAGDDELSAMDHAFRSMAAALADAREQEQSLVSNAREVICSLSADLKFLSINPAIELLIGYQSEELLGARFVSILDATSIDQSLEYFSDVKDANASRPLENLIVCKDGTQRDFSWSVQWTQSKQAYFCVAHDVTESKNLEKMKQAFIAMVSHDLRSPLCSIQAYTDLLERGGYGELTPAGKDSLRNVNGSISRLIDLVSDLIDIERLETGNLPLDIKPVAVKELFDQSLQSVSELAASRNISLQSSDGSVRVLADAGRITQVLVNLLSNAIKFSPDGSIVELQAQASDGIATLSVADHGRGIPKEQLSTVFERFKQVQASDSANRKGSGLGLSICKAIVEQHGGKIAVESEAGVGSRFYVELPVA